VKRGAFLHHQRHTKRFSSGVVFADIRILLGVWVGSGGTRRCCLWAACPPAVGPMPFFASHCLKGSAFFEGIDWIIQSACVCF